MSMYISNYVKFMLLYYFIKFFSLNTLKACPKILPSWSNLPSCLHLLSSSFFCISRLCLSSSLRSAHSFSPHSLINASIRSLSLNIRIYIKCICNYLLNHYALNYFVCDNIKFVTSKIVVTTNTH